LQIEQVQKQMDAQ